VDTVINTKSTFKDGKEHIPYVKQRVEYLVTYFMHNEFGRFYIRKFVLNFKMKNEATQLGRTTKIDANIVNYGR